MRPDAFNELRGENPVPEWLPAPAIEPLLRRLDQEPLAPAHSPEVDDRSPRPGRPRRSRIRAWAKLSLNALPLGLAGLAAIGIAVVALTVVRHHTRQPSTHTPAISGRQRLIDILGVLRHPQTKADLNLWLFKRPQSSPLIGLQGAPDRSLVRLATVTPWGEKIFLVPFKPPTRGSFKRQFPRNQGLEHMLALGRARGETLGIFSNGGGEGAGTATDIEAGVELETGGAGRSFAGGSTRTRLVLVVPDGGRPGRVRDAPPARRYP